MNGEEEYTWSIKHFIGDLMSKYRDARIKSLWDVKWLETTIYLKHRKHLDKSESNEKATKTMIGKFWEIHH